MGFSKGDDVDVKVIKASRYNESVRITATDSVGWALIEKFVNLFNEVNYVPCDIRLNALKVVHSPKSHNSSRMGKVIE